MTNELVLLGSTLVTTTVGAFIGAWFSSRFAYTHQGRAERDKRRQTAGDETLAPLVKLQKLLQNAQFSRSNKEWVATIQASYDALDDARHLMPPALGHLKRSVRSALGEAMGGVAITDLSPALKNHEMEPYEYRWVTYAEEYLSGVIDAIRRWRDASGSNAASVTYSDFDGWLAQTGRYRSGE
jgi:hypothetical protein